MRDSKFYSKVSPKNNGDFLNERERDFEPINKMTSNRKMGFTKKIKNKRTSQNPFANSRNLKSTTHNLLHLTDSFRNKSFNALNWSSKLRKCFCCHFSKYDQNKKKIK